jgi:exopolysaccharide biosynthesis polyprenyl glycosylphosphotransferase
MRLFLRFLMMDVLHLIPMEAIAFIGWTPSMQRVLRGYHRDVGRFQSVVGYLENGEKEAPSEGLTAYRSLGSLADLEKIAETHRITLLIVDENALSAEQLRNVVLACSRASLHFRMIPAAFDILTRRISTRTVAGIPLIGAQGVPLDFFANRILKRAVDIFGAGVGLLLSSVPIAILAILIILESPGPIFYRQVRLGKGGRPFRIVKLRSMRLDAEAQTGAKWAVENDPRRLRIGAFMRASNLDETPQFWNVLRGDMSLVGPRPERPEFVEVFNHDVSHYNLRHHCRPGLTSWAAVHGLRGNTSISDRIDHDLYYYEHWSLGLDFLIMVRTLMPPKNAY